MGKCKYSHTGLDLHRSWREGDVSGRERKGGRVWDTPRERREGEERGESERVEEEEEKKEEEEKRRRKKMEGSTLEILHCRIRLLCIERCCSNP